MTLDRDYTALVKTRGPSDGYVRYLKIAPGGDTGWHSHPGIVFALIQSGTLTLYHDDFVPEVYPAGTGFVEDAGCVHLLANEGDVDLEVVVTQIVPAVTFFEAEDYHQQYLEKRGLTSCHI